MDRLRQAATLVAAASGGTWVGRPMESKGISIGQITRQGYCRPAPSSTPSPPTRRKGSLRCGGGNGTLIAMHDNRSNSPAGEAFAAPAQIN